MNGAKTSAAALGVALLVMATPAMAADPSGVWMNREGDTKIRVNPCGGALCGSVAWLGDPTGPDGKAKTDRHNPDPAKRTRRLIGTSVLMGMKASGENKWSGRIYNADDGRTYVSHITLVDRNRMNVQGCVLGGLFCKSMVWTRSN